VISNPGRTSPLVEQHRPRRTPPPATSAARPPKGRPGRHRTSCSPFKCSGRRNVRHDHHPGPRPSHRRRHVGGSSSCSRLASTSRALSAPEVPVTASAPGLPLISRVRVDRLPTSPVADQPPAGRIAAVLNAFCSNAAFARGKPGLACRLRPGRSASPSAPPGATFARSSLARRRGSNNGVTAAGSSSSCPGSALAEPVLAAHGGDLEERSCSSMSSP